MNDEELSLETVLHTRLSRRVRNFRLRLDGDGVVLQGEATTYYVKQLAQHLVMEVTKLPIRANEIEVR